jgi:hypothetical protein
MDRSFKPYTPFSAYYGKLPKSSRLSCFFAKPSTSFLKTTYLATHSRQSRKCYNPCAARLVILEVQTIEHCASALEREIWRVSLELAAIWVISQRREAIPYNVVLCAPIDIFLGATTSTFTEPSPKPPSSCAFPEGATGSTPQPGK